MEIELKIILHSYLLLFSRVVERLLERLATLKLFTNLKTAIISASPLTPH